MKNLMLIFIILIDVQICFGQIDSSTRDPYKWPFSQQSIWNMPIGSEARYVHAGIQKAIAFGMTKDEDIIVLSPNSPPTDIFINNAKWDKNKDRCTKDGDLLFSAPIPENFIVNKNTWDGTTPNSGLSVLMPDGVTIKQTQPFARCQSYEFGTSKYVFSDVNIYSDGYYGAHGGSGLSAIGGTLRLGELMPNTVIRHALKVNLYAARNLYYDNTTKGYRWPALRADSFASSTYGTQRTTNIVKECRMGALLVLPIWMDIDSIGFETEPAKILAQAFQNYGAYIVDDTWWDVYAIVTEWSPKGRFSDEFEKQWGFSFTPSSKNTPWSRDMDRIFLNLYIVDNNSKDSIGGGGTPLMPLAPNFNTMTSIKTTIVDNNIKIYPNPTKEITTIEMNNPLLMPVKITMQNSLGNIIYQNYSNSNRFEINMTEFESGVYIIKIENNGDVFIEKIIKTSANTLYSQ
ncbi:MAG: T9SS type A sorting domain-containing protein [Lentimicrobiaceae bacterium]|jgi:hypothetical protein